MSQIGSPIGGPTRIGNCMVGKKANPKTQFLFDHSSCCTLIYSYGEDLLNDKCFCRSCFHKHKSEIPSMLMDSVSTISYAICDFLRREDELMTELMNHKRSTS
jgi:hypothetical protein